MRKITFGVIIAATAVLAIALVVRVPHPATASAPASATKASATIDPHAMQSTIDGIESLPRLPDYPN